MSKPISNLFQGTKGNKSVHNHRIIPGKDGIVTGGKSNDLGKNMLKEMGIINIHTWKGYQAQHIIPAEMANHPIIKKIGMDMDDASNGIFLQTPKKNVSTKSRHKGYHSVYSNFVKQELDKIDLKSDIISIQRQVYLLQTKLRKLQQSGLPLYASEGATIDLWTRHFNKLK